MSIHPTAVISSRAILAKDIEIGPYCVIGDDVTLEERVRLSSHVVIEGKTHIGKDTVIHSFASVGQSAQHLSFKTMGTELIIGAHNVIREHVTIHRGTVEGGGKTLIGSHNFFMVGCHIAHDCCIGNRIVMANHAAIGGHVLIEDHAVIGGLVGVHQFTRIGEGAMIGGYSAIGECVIPYGLIVGNRGKLEGLNIRKLKKLEASCEEIDALSKTYEWIFYNKLHNFMYRVQNIPEPFLKFSRVHQIKDFILSNVKRSICFPRQHKNGSFEVCAS
jgi:UDP-N-acetylglucosamine acyltransferase